MKSPWSSLVCFCIAWLLPYSVSTVMAKPKGPVVRTAKGVIPVFPSSHPLNKRIDKLRKHPLSDNYIRSIGVDTKIWADFNRDGGGIPFTHMPKKTKPVNITFEYHRESDKGPYYIPPNALIEGGPDANGDRHVIVLDPYRRKVYELFHAYKVGNGWKAGSGAIFDLRSNTMRKEGYTSADAAGLSIFGALIRYDEIALEKSLRHAVRVTVKRSQAAHIFPARHHASRSTDPNLPPMGLRLRLKASVDISDFPEQARVILTGFKLYGLIVADNGSDMYFQGEPHPKWHTKSLRALSQLKAGDFEAVYSGELIK